MIHTLSLLCHLLVASTFVVGGGIYCATPKLHPYHVQLLGRSWESLDPTIQHLFRAFMVGGGSCAIGLGIALLFLILIPFRRREPWCTYALTIISLAGALPLFAITLFFRFQRGIATPWRGALIVLFFIVIGFVLGEFSRKKNG